MKVYVVPADSSGCGHYRLIWPAYICNRLGVDVQVLPPMQGSGFRAKIRRTSPDDPGTIIGLEAPKDADVMVVQRPAHQFQPQMIKLLRYNGIAVVVDMDDDMTKIHRDNVAWRTYHPRSTSPMSWKYASESCKNATFVTTSTSELQKVYASPGRGAVLDNYVPAKCLTYNKPVTGAFGWAGTTQSHPDDLQVVGSTVKRLCAEGEKFTVIGGQSKVRQALRLDQEPNYTGGIPLELWIKTIAESIDIGMVPLSASPFNTSKSRLKGIEMMAAGVPWVASPRQEYRRLHRESGCGYLAETPKDWYNHLTRLLKDDVLRKEQAEQGREYMQDQTYEQQAWRWAEAWETAYKIQRGLT